MKRLEDSDNPQQMADFSYMMIMNIRMLPEEDRLPLVLGMLRVLYSIERSEAAGHEEAAGKHMTESDYNDKRAKLFDSIEQLLRADYDDRKRYDEEVERFDIT